LIVRKATFGDIPAILELGKTGHAQSENAQYEFDEQGARLLVASCVSQKALCAFVAEQDGRIVGFLLGQEDRLPYLKMRYATDLVLYAAHPGAGRRLVEVFTDWGLGQRKVDQMMLGVSFGGRSKTKAESFYTRLGFKPVGGIFIKNRSAS
jgi:hypothetical protein